jgi:hypothetical protein
MHATVGETGMSPFQALSQLVAACDAGIASDHDLLLEAATWSKGQYVSVAQSLKQLSEVTAEGALAFITHNSVCTPPLFNQRNLRACETR